MDLSPGSFMHAQQGRRNATVAGRARVPGGTVWRKRRGTRFTMRRAVALAAACCLAQPVAQAKDDHGDSFEESSLLGLGATVPDRLERPGDTDMFRLEMVGAAEIEARTSGPTDTRGELLDSTGALLLSDRDSGPRSKFSITATLSPGVLNRGGQGATPHRQSPTHDDRT